MLYVSLLTKVYAVQAQILQYIANKSTHGKRAQKFDSSRLFPGGCQKLLHNGHMITHH